MTSKAVDATGNPAVAERQFQVMVDFLEAQLVAENIFIEVAGDRVTAVMLFVEWFPRIPVTVYCGAE